MNWDRKYFDEVQHEVTLMKAYKKSHADVVAENEKCKELLDHIFRLTACDYTRDCIVKELEGVK